MNTSHEYSRVWTGLTGVYRYTGGLQVSCRCTIMYSSIHYLSQFLRCKQTTRTNFIDEHQSLFVTERKQIVLFTLAVWVLTMAMLWGNLSNRPTQHFWVGPRVFLVLLCTPIPPAVLYTLRTILKQLRPYLKNDSAIYYGALLHYKDYSYTFYHLISYQ